MTRFLALSVMAPGPLESDILDRTSEVVYRSCPNLPNHFSSAQDWALADLAMLSAGQQAAAEGFDALCLTDFGDYGWGALQSVLTIPVVSAGRSTMLYALTLGTYFSVLTGATGYNRTKKLVWEYGLEKQCVSVCQVTTTGFAQLHNMAMHCIEKDGAEIICLTTETAAHAAALAASVPVPVIEPSTLTLKLAESLVGLELAQSQHAYPEPQVRKADLITALARTPAR